jgi:hypothetical protein
MDTKQIKANSSTLLILKYLGMRTRMRKPWVTDLEIASFFPHKFQKRSSKAADVRTALKHLLKAEYVISKQHDSVTYYTITELGKTIPFVVAHRLANSPTYQFRTKHPELELDLD